MVSTKPDEIIKPQKLKTVKELGMPFFNSPYKFGNLYLDFQIEFPNKLKETEVKKITEILKDERLHSPVDPEKVGEKYFMTDYKASEENSHHAGGRKEDSRRDEDDEDEEGGQYHRTVNCANQ